MGRDWEIGYNLKSLPYPRKPQLTLLPAAGLVRTHLSGQSLGRRQGLGCGREQPILEAEGTARAGEDPSQGVPWASAGSVLGLEAGQGGLRADTERGSRRPVKEALLLVARPALRARQPCSDLASCAPVPSFCQGSSNRTVARPFLHARGRPEQLKRENPGKSRHL